MVTRATWIKNIAFLLIAVLVLGYLGTRYADLGRYVGAKDHYTVRVQLGQTGGLFTHSEVTYRGVGVGRVGPIDLTDKGVEAELHIRKDAPAIPADLDARVASFSAVGEQYIDLRPRTDGGPYLEEDSVIAKQSTSTPPPVTNLLTGMNRFATTLDTEALRVAVNELGDAVSERSDDLQVLLDEGGEFVAAADASLPTSTKLMVDGETVLRTQNEEGEAFSDFAAGAKELSAQLKASDPDLRAVIEQAPQAAQQVTGLLRDLDPGLSVLLANLLTISDVAITRQGGFEQLLVQLPQVVAAGSTVVTSKGMRLGMALTFFDPLPCTAGYGATKYRNGLDISPAKGLNTAARCISPASSGKNVRGSAHAPRGGVPDAAKPGALLAAGTEAGVEERAAAGAAEVEPLPGALGLPALPTGGPKDMSGLLGLDGSSGS